MLTGVMRRNTVFAIALLLAAILAAGVFSVLQMRGLIGR
jgi:hypothetical protein